MVFKFFRLVNRFLDSRFSIDSRFCRSRSRICTEPEAWHFEVDNWRVRGHKRLIRGSFSTRVSVDCLQIKGAFSLFFVLRQIILTQFHDLAQPGYSKRPISLLLWVSERRRARWILILMLMVVDGRNFTSWLNSTFWWWIDWDKGCQGLTWLGIWSIERVNYLNEPCRSMSGAKL